MHIAHVRLTTENMLKTSAAAHFVLGLSRLFIIRFFLFFSSIRVLCISSLLLFNFEVDKCTALCLLFRLPFSCFCCCVVLPPLVRCIGHFKMHSHARRLDIEPVLKVMDMRTLGLARACTHTHEHKHAENLNRCSSRRSRLAVHAEMLSPYAHRSGCRTPATACQCMRVNKRFC